MKMIDSSIDQCDRSYSILLLLLQEEEEEESHKREFMNGMLNWRITT